MGRDRVLVLRVVGDVPITPDALIILLLCLYGNIAPDFAQLAIDQRL